MLIVQTSLSAKVGCNSFDTCCNVKTQGSDLKILRTEEIEKSEMKGLLDSKNEGVQAAMIPA